jgi:hypothetical protein
MGILNIPGMKCGYQSHLYCLPPVGCGHFACGFDRENTLFVKLFGRFQPVFVAAMAFRLRTPSQDSSVTKLLDARVFHLQELKHGIEVVWYWRLSTAC